MKIKVLSSHHEDNFFRLHFQVWDPMEKSTFKPLSIVSAAVKVISKPLKPKTPKPKATPVAKPKPAKRKAADMDEEEEEEDDEMVLEQMPSALESTLELVARQQRETLEILHRLASVRTLLLLPLLISHLEPLGHVPHPHGLWLAPLPAHPSSCQAPTA